MRRITTAAAAAAEWRSFVACSSRCVSKRTPTAFASYALGTRVGTARWDTALHFDDSTCPLAQDCTTVYHCSLSLAHGSQLHFAAASFLLRARAGASLVCFASSL